MTTSIGTLLLLIASLVVIAPVVTAQNLRERKLQTPALTTTGTVKPFGNCEGKCFNDDDCQRGLVCLLDTFSPSVPGCSGQKPAFSFNSNYCITAPPGQLVILGNDGDGPFPLGECEGDCDTDDECGEGLLCFYRNGNSVQRVPGCSGSGSPGTDYCFRSSSDRPTRAPSTNSPTLTPKPTSLPSKAPVSVAPTNPAPTEQPTTPRPTRSPVAIEPLTTTGTVKPFGNCEGKCMNDDDCQRGLVCLLDTFSASVPGCSGEKPAFSFNSNYCITAPPGQLVILGNDGDGPFPLGECEGDCDTDDECGEGLLCFYRNGNSVQRVPGCSGSGSPGTDYCFRSSSDRPTRAPSTNSPTLTPKPTSLPSKAPVSVAPTNPAPTEQPTAPRPTRSPIALEPLTTTGTVKPFGNCEGKCFNDDDCQRGLVCLLDTFSPSVPGCSGEKPAFSFNSNYCITAPPGQLVILGNDGDGPFPLGECEGDCDTDDECGEGLLCFYRNGNSVQRVPGCSGSGSPGTDYCFRSSSDRPTRAPSTSSPTLTPKPTSLPSKAPLSVAPTNPAPTEQPTAPRPTRSPIALEPLTTTGTVKPFGNCEGSCVIDSDCGNGLVCFRDQFASVPGCTGVRSLFGFANYCIVAPPGQLVVQGNDGIGSSFPLGECEGDCDTDDECGPGLLCFFRSGIIGQGVPGCFGAGSPGTDYCFRSSSDRPTRAPSSTVEPTSSPSISTPSSAPVQADSLKTIASGPFGNCEGSCNDDIECEFGLNCYKPPTGFKAALSGVPGCSGYNFNGDNFCTDPAPFIIVIEGRDGVPASAFPLGNCEGVCASDDDCEGSLECFFRVSNEKVRGCEGMGSSGVSYCSNPLALALSNVYPLGICEGGCNNDSDCGEGLVCFERNNLEPIPGCFGIGFLNLDYCIPGTPIDVPTEPEATLPPTPSTVVFPFPGIQFPFP